MRLAAWVAVGVCFTATSGCFGETIWPEFTEGEEPVVDLGPPILVSLSAQPDEGPTPLRVNFSFELYRADNQTIDWSLDANTDGTPDFTGIQTGNSLLNRWHVYATPGKFTASLTTTDEAGRFVNDSIIIDVAEGQVWQIQSFSGELDYQTCSFVDDYLEDGFVPDLGEELDDLVRTDIKVNPDTRRQTFETRWHFSEGFHEGHTLFAVKNGTIMDSESDYGGPDESFENQGRVHKNAYWVILVGCGSNSDYSVVYESPRADPA